MKFENLTVKFLLKCYIINSIIYSLYSVDHLIYGPYNMDHIGHFIHTSVEILKSTVLGNGV